MQPEQISQELASALRSLRARSASGRPALASFRVARAAVEAREAERLARDEAAVGPVIRSLPRAASSRLSWLRLRWVLGLEHRRRLARWQGLAAGLVAAALLGAVALPGRPQVDEWQRMRAEARPVEVVIVEPGSPAQLAQEAEPNPWSLPGSLR